MESAGFQELLAFVTACVLGMFILPGPSLLLLPKMLKIQVSPNIPGWQLPARCSLVRAPSSSSQLPKFAEVHNDSQGGWVRFTKNANTPHNFTIVSKMPQKATGTSTRSTMGSQTLTNGHQKSTKNSQRVHSSHQASGNPQQNARQTSTNVDSKQQTISTNNITNQLPHSVPALAAS
jgi:hypothetical protein